MSTPKKVIKHDLSWINDNHHIKNQYKQQRSVIPKRKQVIKIKKSLSSINNQIASSISSLNKDTVDQLIEINTKDIARYTGKQNTFQPSPPPPPFNIQSPNTEDNTLQPPWQADDTDTGSISLDSGPTKDIHEFKAEPINSIQDNHSKIEAVVSTLYVQHNIAKFQELTRKLTKAIDDNDVELIKHLYPLTNDVRLVSFSKELLQKARLIIALSDAINKNDILDIKSCMHQIEQSSFKDDLKCYRIASYYLQIDAMLTSDPNNLNALKELYDEIINIFPDIPNIQALRDAIYKLETKNTFKRMTEKSVKTMILDDMEDAIIYAKDNQLQDSKLYEKLEKLFHNEQNRRYKLSNYALSKQINFDQILYQEDETKRINYQNGKNNFHFFESHFKIETTDSDSDHDTLSISWTSDLPGLTNQNDDIESAERLSNELGLDLNIDIDEETINTDKNIFAVKNNTESDDILNELGIDIDITEESTNTTKNEDETDDEIVIERLSDEDDSEYDTNADAASDVDQMLNINDIMEEYDVEINENAMKIDEIIELEQTEIVHSKSEPFIPFCTEIDELISRFQFLADKYRFGDNLAEFKKLRPLSSFKKFFSTRKKFYCGVHSEKQMLSHTTKPIPRSITYLNANALGIGKKKCTFLKKSAERLFNINLLTIMGHRNLQQNKEENLENMLFEYLLIAEKQPLLCNEIYCQLMKQTTDNEYQESCLIAWKLLYLLCLYKKPSDEILPFIINHCLNNALPLNRNIMRFNKIPEIAANCIKYVDADLRKKSLKIVRPSIDWIDSVNRPKFDQNEFCFGLASLPQSGHRPYPCLNSNKWMNELHRLFVINEEIIKVNVYGNCKKVKIQVKVSEEESCIYYAKLACSKLKIKLTDDYTFLFRIDKYDVSEKLKLFQDRINEMIEIGVSFIVIIEYIKYVKLTRCKDLKYKWILYKWCISVYDKELEYESIEYIQSLYQRTKLEIAEGETYKLNKIEMAMAVTMEILNDDENNSHGMFDIEALEQEILYKYLPKYAQKQLSFREWKQVILKIYPKLGEMKLIATKDKLRYYTAYLTHVSNEKLYGLTFIGVRIMFPNRINNIELSKFKVYFVGINWTKFVILNINKQVLEEWDIKQIKYLNIETASKNHIKFRIELSDTLFIPIQFYVFEPFKLELFKHKVKELQMYIPKVDLSLF